MFSFFSAHSLKQIRNAQFARAKKRKTIFIPIKKKAEEKKNKWVEIGLERSAEQPRNYYL